MRAIWISAVLFISVALLVAGGIGEIRRARAELSDAIAALPSEPGEEAVAQAEELLAMWQEHRGYLDLFVHRERLRAVELQLSALRATAELGEEAVIEYELARLGLEEVLGEV